MSDYVDLAVAIGAPAQISPPTVLQLDGADGTRLSALDWGGSGPNCLFLHGGAMSAETWTQCCLLLDRRYRCVAVDLRGHGDSSWSDDYTIPAHVADTLRVLEQLNWTAAHLVGMSLGGVVAAHTATALRTPPASLTLVDVAPGVSFQDVGRIRGFMGSGLERQGPEALIAAARKLGAPQSEVELGHRYRSLTRQKPDGTWTWRHDTRHPTDFEHILDHIAKLADLASAWPMPCLVVRGGRSRILSEAAGRAFADRCQNGAFATVNAAGHSVQEDNPQELANLLDGFWTQHITRSLQTDRPPQ